MWWWWWGVLMGSFGPLINESMKQQLARRFSDKKKKFLLPNNSSENVHFVSNTRVWNCYYWVVSLSFLPLCHWKVVGKVLTVKGVSRYNNVFYYLMAQKQLSPGEKSMICLRDRDNFNLAYWPEFNCKAGPSDKTDSAQDGTSTEVAKYTMQS